MIMSMDKLDDRFDIERLERIGATVCQLEAELAAMTAERDAWQAKFVRRLQAVDELTAAKELAERQVAILCGHIDDYGSCCNCPAKVLGAACSHSGESCREQLAAWSRAEASEGGKE
jgi:hypothetical protein